jgi:hypothetical protein
VNLTEENSKMLYWGYFLPASIALYLLSSESRDTNHDEFFFKKMILLAYSGCTGGYIVIFTYVLAIYLNYIYSLRHSPSSSFSPSSLNNFISFHSSVFAYGYKTHPPYTPSFPLSCAHSPPTGTHPWEKIYFSLLSFTY